MTNQCEKCGHIQIMNKTKSTSDKKIEYPAIFKEQELIECKSLPLYVKLTHKGFWVTNSDGVHQPSQDEGCNRNSIMISEDCLLYVYKLAFRHLLLSMKIVHPDEIDSANLVPHVVVRKNKDDPFSKYKSIQNEHFLIDESAISSKNDFIIVELDKKRDLHMTLIFSKGLGKKMNLVEAFTNVIKLLNYSPELIDVYTSLAYFGNKEINYWYETGNLYPNNIYIPVDYVPPVKQVHELKITNAGSII